MKQTLPVETRSTIKLCLHIYKYMFFIFNYLQIFKIYAELEIKWLKNAFLTNKYRWHFFENPIQFF